MQIDLSTQLSAIAFGGQHREQEIQIYSNLRIELDPSKKYMLTPEKNSFHHLMLYSVGKITSKA